MSRFGLTSSPLKKAPSIYKSTPKKKLSRTNQNSPSFGMYQLDNIISEEFIEEKTSPKKSPIKRSSNSPKSPYSNSTEIQMTQTYQSTQNSKSLRKLSKCETYYQPNKPVKSIEELKNEYQELVDQYNNALQVRENLKKDCQSLDSDLQKAYKRQGRLNRQLRKKSKNQPSTSNK